MTIESEATGTTTAAAPPTRARRGRKKDDEGGGESVVSALESRLNLDDPDLAEQSALQHPDREEKPEPEGDDDRELETRQSSAADPASGDTGNGNGAGTQAEEEQPGLSGEMQRVLTSRRAVEPQTKADKAAAKAAERDARERVSPSLRKFGKLAQKMPGAERAKVHKRMANGQLALVGEYGLKDLTQSQDLESFLYHYVMPKYGPGDYEVRGVDAKGNEYDAGIISLLGPDEEPKPQGELSALGLLQRQLELDREDRRSRDRGVRAPEKDPIDQAAKLIDLSDRIGGGKGDGGLGAVVNGLIQMMQQSESRMIALLENRGDRQSDPLLSTVVTKLLEEKKEAPRGELPPMPPPVDPMLQMKAFAETMAAMMGTMAAMMRPPQDSGNSELVKYLLARADSDKLSSKDLIDLMDKMRGERGTDDFKKSIDNLTLFMQLKNTMDGGGGSVVGDVVSALANSKLPDSLANLIRSRSAPKQLPADTGERDRMTRALEGASRRIAQLEQQLQQLQQGAAAPAATTVEQAAVVTPAPAPSPVRLVQPVPAQQQPAAAQVAPASVPPGPKLPPKIADHVNALVSARDDDAALVEAAMQLIYYLTEPEVDETLRRFGAVILEHVKRGEQDKTLEFARSFFGGLHKLGFLDQDLCDKIVAALQAHFGEIVEYVNNPDEDDDEGDDEDDDSAEGHTTQ